MGVRWRAFQESRLPLKQNRRKKPRRRSRTSLASVKGPRTIIDIPSREQKRREWHSNHLASFVKYRVEKLLFDRCRFLRTRAVSVGRASRSRNRYSLLTAGAIVNNNLYASKCSVMLVVRWYVADRILCSQFAGDITSYRRHVRRRLRKVSFTAALRSHLLEQCFRFVLRAFTDEAAILAQLIDKPDDIYLNLRLL